MEFLTESWSTSPRYDIWVREGVLPDFPNSRAPQFDFDGGQLVVPHPPTSRKEIQEPFIRDMEIPPEEYYPEGYPPELLQEWPVDGDLVVPLEALPPSLIEGVGQNWRDHQICKKHISESQLTNSR